MSNAQIGNAAYFDTLSINMRENGYKIFDFLANLDLTGYDVRYPSLAHGQRVNENTFRVQLVEDSLSEPLQYVISIAQHEQKAQFIGPQSIDLPELSNAEFKCQQSEFYDKFAAWYLLKNRGESKYLCKPRSRDTTIGIPNEKKQWTDENGDRIRKWGYTFTFDRVREGFRTLLKNPAYDFQWTQPKCQSTS
jgi:hypothetical protein